MLKFFTEEEQEAFNSEVQENLRLHPLSQLSVRMSGYSTFQERIPFGFDEQVFVRYSYILLPYASRGTVLSLLMAANEQHRKLSRAQEKHQFRSFLNSVAELRSLSGLVHLDLKPDNVVLDEHYRCKLIDFGHSSTIGAPLTRVTGTP